MVDPHAVSCGGDDRVITEFAEEALSLYRCTDKQSPGPFSNRIDGADRGSWRRVARIYCLGPGKEGEPEIRGAVTSTSG